MLLQHELSYDAQCDTLALGSGDRMAQQPVMTQEGSYLLYTLPVWCLQNLYPSAC